MLREDMRGAALTAASKDDAQARARRAQGEDYARFSIGARAL